MGWACLCESAGGPPAPLGAEPGAPKHGSVSSPSCPGSLPGPGEQPPQM